MYIQGEKTEQFINMQLSARHVNNQKMKHVSSSCEV